ncbi:integrase, catalytic region, zinc finger, CCHC-type containing protein [Tanacetum coccineum]
MMRSSPIFLLSKASNNKSRLWHRCLNYLNFGTLNDLARKDLVRGLPRLKFEKDHLCSACQLGKSRKATYKPKMINTIMKVLHTLHMDLCGPLRVQSINEKKYILVIVDDYSRFTWVKFLRSKDETPAFVINLLKQLQVGLNKTIWTMLIFSKAQLFLWAEAIATACYTQNRSLIHTLHDKTPYELVHDKKLDLLFLRVFGALCYPTNDSEDLGKLKAKADIGFFVGYAPNRKGYRIYNKRTRQIMETIHVTFDELTEQTALVHSSPGPTPNLMTSVHIIQASVLNVNKWRLLTTLQAPFLKRKEKCTIQCALSSKEEKSSYNMANEHVLSPATTRSDDQILLFNAYVSIGKALTASANAPSSFTTTTETTSTLPPPPLLQQSTVH